MDVPLNTLKHLKHVFHELKEVKKIILKNIVEAILRSLLLYGHLRGGVLQIYWITETRAYGIAVWLSTRDKWSFEEIMKLDRVYMKRDDGMSEFVSTATSSGKGKKRLVW